MLWESFSFFSNLVKIHFSDIVMLQDYMFASLPLNGPTGLNRVNENIQKAERVVSPLRPFVSRVVVDFS